MIKIQLARISKSYLKFRDAPELSHSVHPGISPPDKHSPPSFCQAPCKLFKPPFLGNSPYIYFFVTTPPLNIGESSDFSLFLIYAKNGTPPPWWKKTPPFSQQPPCKNWDPVRPPSLKIWLKIHSPPQQKGGRG